MPVSDYDPIFEEAGREWNVDPNLLRAVAHQESGGKPKAVSYKGATGVMQIMPPTGGDLGVTDLNDPAQSIFGGAKYLRQLMDRYQGKPNATQLAVAAYNAGPDRVDAWISGKGSLPNETQAYLPAIGAHYAKYSKAAPQGATPTSARAGKDDSGVPSDEDFLKQVAPKSAPKAAPVPNDDDFLKGVGAKPVEPEKPAEMPGMEGMNEPTIGVGPAEDAKPTSAPPTSAAARIGNAMSDAYNNAPNPLMTENFQHALEDSGAIGRGASAVLDGAGKLIRFIPAGVAGGMAAVGEGATALGAPSLGRDLNIASQVVPMAHMGAGVPALAGAPKAAPRFVGEHFGELTPADTVAAPLSPEFRANPLAPGAAEKVAAAPQNALTAEQASPVPTMVVRPEPAPVEAAGPKSVGAAASRDMTAPEVIEAKTPAQAARDLDSSVHQTAADRAGPQGVDNEVHVPGVERTLAAREFSPENSRAEKTLRAQDPEFDKQMRAQDKANNDTMIDYYNHHAGDAISLEREREALRDLAPDKQKVFADQKPVDAQPVADKIDELLAGDNGKRAAVRSTLEDVKKSLYDSDGNLETLPQMLYGVRKNITDKLNSKATDSLASNAKASRAELNKVLDKLDEIIPQGAPKFKDYLANYADQAKVVDQQKFLQDQLSGAGKITDAQGNLRYNQVQKLLEKAAADRKKTGISPAKSLTDEQVQALIAIRNELAAKAYKDELARAPGSDTAQNAFTAGNIAKGALKKVGSLAVKAPLAYVTHGMSTVADNLLVKPAVEARRAHKAEKATQQLKNRLLQTNSNSNPLNP